MRKITGLAMVLFFLLIPSFTDAEVTGCQKCTMGVSDGVFAPICGTPNNGGWGYEYCEIKLLPKPGYFAYCVESGPQCMYVEVR